MTKCVFVAFVQTAVHYNSCSPLTTSEGVAPLAFFLPMISMDSTHTAILGSSAKFGCAWFAIFSSAASSFGSYSSALPSCPSVGEPGRGEW